MQRMPIKKELSGFKLNTGTLSEDDLRNEIERYREGFREELRQIDGIDCIRFKIQIMLSILESMAQESVGYSTCDSAKIFCDFVLKHQHVCDYLDKIDPVSLYYRVEEHLPIAMRSEKPRYRWHKFNEDEVSVYDLPECTYTLAKDYMTTRKSQTILKYLSFLGIDEKQIEKIKTEHRLINLIYKMRSKIAHEQVGLGVESPLFYDNKIDEPYYMESTRLYEVDGKVFQDDAYELQIPEIFIRRILESCIDSYLTECMDNLRRPYSNNKLTRFAYLSWYDNGIKLKKRD